MRGPRLLLLLLLPLLLLLLLSIPVPLVTRTKKGSGRGKEEGRGQSLPDKRNRVGLDFFFAYATWRSRDVGNASFPLVLHLHSAKVTLPLLAFRPCGIAASALDFDYRRRDKHSTRVKLSIRGVTRRILLTDNLCTCACRYCRSASSSFADVGDA